MFRISTVTITGWSKRYGAAELCKESANPPVAGPTGVVAERICTEDGIPNRLPFTAVAPNKAMSAVAAKKNNLT
jgi:hypothetical protein